MSSKSQNKSSKNTKVATTKDVSSKDVSPSVPTETTPVVVAAPVVVAPVVVAPTEVAQVGGAKSKKSKSAKAVNQESVPVVAVAPVVEEVAQVGGAKAKKSKAVKTTSAVKTTGAVKGTKSAKAPKAPKAPKATSTATEDDAPEAVTNSDGKVVRSFKVMLPGVETYEGRFTGLTPYQAANKALSKYYRETEQPKKEIVFTIRESTRGSKRSTYTYNGKREKLTVPVEYSIKDGRTIVKNFKNRLVKVKKNETNVTA